VAGVFQPYDQVFLQIKARDFYLCATLQCQFVRADARRGPVGRRHGVDGWGPALHDAAHKLVDQVGMRAVMPAALFKQKVAVAIAVMELMSSRMR
jgi:hypothetical protein